MLHMLQQLAERCLNLKGCRLFSRCVEQLTNQHSRQFGNVSVHASYCEGHYSSAARVSCDAAAPVQLVVMPSRALSQSSVKLLIWLKLGFPWAEKDVTSPLLEPAKPSLSGPV